METAQDPQNPSTASNEQDWSALDDRQDHFYVQAVTGQRSSECVLLHDGKTTVANRFAVLRQDGLFQVESLSDKDLMIGGRFVQIALIEPGEVVVTEVGEFRLEKLPAGTRKRQRMMRRLTATVAVLFAGMVVWSLAAPQSSPFGQYLNKKTLLEGYADFEQAFSTKDNTGTGNGTAQNTPTQSASASPQTSGSTASAANSRSSSQTPGVAAGKTRAVRIAEARMRYQIAKSYLKDADLQPVYLYHAIRELEALVQSLEGMKPEPAIREQASKALLDTHHRYKRKINEMSFRFQMAAKVGDKAQAEHIAHQLMAIAHNENSQTYKQAQTDLKRLSGN